MTFVTQGSGKERFIVHFEKVVFAAVLLICGPVSAGSLNFSAIDFPVPENSPTVTIYVARTGSTANAASVTVVSSDGTASAGSDYVAVSQALSWGVGDSGPKSVTITLNDDALVEGTEFFTLSLSSPVGDGTSGDSTVTLNDYEEGKLQFSSANFAGTEDSLKVTARINRVSGTAGAATVKIKTGAGSPPASDQSDYTSLDTTVSFADGESYKDVVVSLNNDNVAEFAELLTLTLSDPTGATLGTTVVANAEIEDDDEDFTSTLKLLNKSTTNVTIPQQIDLNQNSLLDSKIKTIDLVNTIPILTLTGIEAKQDADGLMTIDVETSRAYLRPIAIKRASAGAASEINVTDDINSTFVTSQGWFLEATPALAAKGVTVLQKALAAIFLPTLVIEQNGNLTIQEDQGAPPFERDALNNIIVNYSYYNRWNLRPSMISTISSGAAEGYSLVPHPLDAKEVVLAVNYNDGSNMRQQILSPAPIDGPELIQELKTNGISRCALYPGAGCNIGVSNPKQLANGIIRFDVIRTLADGKKQTIQVTLFSDYRIRKTPNFVPSMVGFTEVNDINKDSFGDYKMIYANGEEQYFFLQSSFVK